MIVTAPLTPTITAAAPQPEPAPQAPQPVPIAAPVGITSDDVKPLLVIAAAVILAGLILRG